MSLDYNRQKTLGRWRFYQKLIGHLSLVDETTFKLVAKAKDDATASAVLSPFFQHDSPFRENETSIVYGVEDRRYIHAWHSV